MTIRIAIPEPTSSNEEYNGRSLPQYLQALKSAGAEGVPLRLRDTVQQQDELLAGCAGILLPGSPADMDPARYGQEPKDSAPKDALREAADDRLLLAAHESGRPLFGICFGLQSLNVWRHGTLVQDLPSAFREASVTVDHDPGREVRHAHDVVVTPRTLLSTVLPAAPGAGEGAGGGEPLTIPVNSSHHQAIDLPGDSLVVAARSVKDGVIEALEGSEPDRFTLAVQWHPERSYEHSEASRALFASFVAAAGVWAAKNPSAS